MMPDNRRSPQPPPNFKTTPESLIADTQELIEGIRAVIDEIVASVNSETATFKNVVLPMALKENESSLSERIIGFYQHVSPHKNLCDASSEADRIMDKFFIERYIRRDMCTLVDAVYKKGEVLDAEAQRLLEREHKKYIKNGVYLPTAEERDRFIKIMQRLSQINTDSMRNLNEENGGVWFTKEELAGVPDDVLQGLKSGSDENNGKLKVSFQHHELTMTLKFALNSDVRRKLIIGNQNKVGYSNLQQSQLNNFTNF
jgi:metallopeptidase MepB